MCVYVYWCVFVCCIGVFVCVLMCVCVCVCMCVCARTRDFHGCMKCVVCRTGEMKIFTHNKN